MWSAKYHTLVKQGLFFLGKFDQRVIVQTATPRVALLVILLKIHAIKQGYGSWDVMCVRM
jgi:hypothetical protein